MAGNDFVSERFTDLGDTEREFHTSGFLDVEEVDEDPLRGFRTQVNFVGTLCHGTHFGFEHQVKLANFGPVTGSRDGAYDAGIENDLTQLFEVVVVESLDHTIVCLVTFGFVFEDTRVGLQELLLVETLAEPFACFFDLFFDLFVLFGDEVLDQHIGTVTFF